ncbi:MAG TPA: DUF1566 domain-containing protein [Actinoplanes sp.]
MRSARLLAGATLVVAALTGCGARTGAAETAAPDPVAFAPTSLAPSTGPDPAASGPVAVIGSAATAPAATATRPTPTKTTRRPATRSGATAGCGSVLASRWAGWPMPNSRGLGLPNERSYTDLGNGSVRDDVTCLVWQKDFSANKVSWAAAKSYCAGLSIGGGGWRLPSRVELTSIIDFSRSGPAIDTSVFRGVANFFWTGSPWAVRHSPPYAWAMNFYEGLTTNAGNTEGAYYARCVRAPVGSGDAQYAVSNGEVRDKQTGLIWQQASSSKTMSAAAARAHCAQLSLNGQSWRLPSIGELATTVDESRVAPAIDRAVFPDTAKSTYYWSSSKSKPQPAQTWGLNYDDGFTNYRNLTAAYVRCVR